MEETRDALEVLAKLKTILPEGGTEFILKLLLKSPVKNIFLQSGGLGLVLRRAFAGFFPEDRTITVDLDFNSKRYAEIILNRHGLKISESEGILFLLLHEVAHSLPQIGGSEERANQWAYEQFIKFRSQN